MDTIGEIIGAIIMFILEVIILIFKIIAAIFIPDQRGSLRKRWQTSVKSRIEIIFSIIILIIASTFMIYLFLNLNGCSSDTVSQEPKSSETKMTDDDKTSKKIEIEISDELKDKAKGYLKEKWENRQ